MGLFQKIFGDLNSKELKKLDRIADQVMDLEGRYSRLDEKGDRIQLVTDEELRAQSEELKRRVQEEGADLDSVLPEAFALCREAAWRTLGMMHFREQVVGGIAMHQGRIAEMKTGEGKTLAATLPVYLNALSGKGVHVVTVNDYLAKRDAEWMGRIYTFLGLTVGCVIHGITSEERHAAYQADITYGTNNEFGFDYLRDNMAVDQSQLMQRPLNFAIVDEVDSILIDEARTPLIISGRGEDSTDMYRKADDFVRGLTGIRVKDKSEANGGKSKLDAILDKEEAAYEETADFVVEEKDKQISLTERGIKKAESFFHLENYGDAENMEINHHVNQALKARNLMVRDVDYIVKGGEIVIVDEFTGRLMEGRRYSNGLHQAIEAKERVSVRAESKTLATITIQNYFRMYQKLAGMTGTAKTEEEEFRDIYNMDVVVVPTHLPPARVDLEDSVYRTEAGKFKAIVDRILEIHKTGKPILVGTISVEKSELLSAMLEKRGIRRVKVSNIGEESKQDVHVVLNAKEDASEADIVAEAGRVNSITIATNMAGRGTDIMLGGNPEHQAKHALRKLVYRDDQPFSEEALAFADTYRKTREEDVTDPEVKALFADPENREALEKYRELYEAAAARCRAERETVIAPATIPVYESGRETTRQIAGLCIIGTERHESRRIDNQLRGRSGRQGDPGCSQFFISLEDELMRLFGGERMQGLVSRLGMEEDDAIEGGLLTKTIENAQKRVEARNFNIRKYVLQYDNVMNKQREVIYGERRKVLFGEDIKHDIMNMRNGIVTHVVESATADSKFAEEWDLAGLNRNIRKLFPEYRGKSSYSEDELRQLTKEGLEEQIEEKLDRLYDEKEREIGAERLRDLERQILLMIVDNKWMDHIDAMDQLRTGIGLRAIGQQDPAAEYAKAGFDMFEEMIANIQEDTVRFCYGLTGQTQLRKKKALTGTAKKDDFRDSGEGMESSENAGAAGGRQAGPGRNAEVPPRENKPQTYRREGEKIGRNKPCPCGSGKKYKDCHGRRNVGGVGDDLTVG